MDKATRERIEALNKEAAENWDDVTWRKSIAQTMSETIFEGFQHENLLGLLTTVENADFNDRITVEEVKGLRAFWTARGGYIEASEITEQVMELPRDMIGFHVFQNEDKLRVNFARSQATMIDLGIERLKAVVNQRVLALFQAAIPSGSSNYTGASGLGLTALNTALRTVRDESKIREVAIIGRSTMTEQIMDELLGGSNNGSGYIPETNEQAIRQGVVGTYRGAKIITLIDHKDDQDISFFPANELYVIGKDASKFAWWGGPMTKEFTEQDNWYWHYIFRRDFGGVVHRPERAWRVVDTAITP